MTSTPITAEAVARARAYNAAARAARAAAVAIDATGVARTDRQREMLAELLTGREVRVGDQAEINTYRGMRPRLIAAARRAGVEVVERDGSVGLCA